ncbi:MAG: hypothetical protein RIC87_17340 [Kiloniellales bacterium]
MSYLFTVRGFLTPESWPWPRSAPEVARLTQAIVAHCDQALRAAATAVDRSYDRDTAEELEGFLSSYARRPLVSNRHGSGLNDSLWLWLVARWMAPQLVVESGSFMGHSAWLFRRACPAASIQTHDVELPAAGRLRSPGVTYHLRDWSEVELPAFDPAHALCFFDDHISHVRRLEEAAARGFRFVLLDDNFPAWQMHATGAPPIPSLAMLEDARDATQSVEWQRNRKHYAYDGRDDTAGREEGARALVQASYRFPDLAPITRLPPGSNLTLVRLRDKRTGVYA